MKKLILFICIGISGAYFISDVYAGRNITLPHTENFEASNSIDDIAWAGKNNSGDNGARVTRVQSSWRGGGNWCLRIDSPTSTAYVNGGYAAIGAFHFPPTNTLNVAFALNVGTTYSRSAANVGGSLINKFIDIFNPTARTGLLGLNDRGIRNAHEFGIAAYPAASYYYYGTPPHPDNDCRGLHFGDGVGTNDYAGQWIFINYVVNHNIGRVLLRIWDRNGNYKSDYFYVDNATVGPTSEIRTIGGYYNESHPSANQNSRLLIDDLIISNDTSVILPPDGFVTGDETVPPAHRGRNIICQ